jgi:ketosteroid isomerase-like protein
MEEIEMPKILLTVLCALAFSPPHCHAQVPATPSQTPLSGTWFGEFVVTSPDGKVSHDTAVLILEQQGSSLTGSIGRTVDQQTPLADASINHSQVRFHLNAGGGMEFVLDLNAGHLTGTATGARVNAKVDLQPAPGLLPQQQLLHEITQADLQLYDAFTTCDVTRYATFLSKDLEFYQDHTGKTGYEQNLKALQNRCAEGIQLRRELEKDSLIVNAAPGYGAIQAGTQRFYSKQQDGSERLDTTARFTNIWSKETGSWKLVRIISYDHH